MNSKANLIIFQLYSHIRARSNMSYTSANVKCLQIFTDLQDNTPAFPRAGRAN